MVPELAAITNANEWVTGDAFFKDIKPIKYAGPKSRDPLTFKYYQPDLVVRGKKMKEWLKFSVCYWHTMMGELHFPKLSF